MRRKQNDSNKILLLAIPFVVGGIILLLSHHDIVVVAAPVHGRVPDAHNFDVETASVPMQKLAGTFGLLVAGGIVWCYFKLRNS